MTTAYSTNLGLALPVQGELSGTWGDTVNNGITQYSDIAIAGTLTLNGDGAVTLANTNGSAAGTNIGSTTAQYAIIKVTGTLTTTKVITAPSSSKTYIVINAATGDSVTLKASGQTGISVAVGESAYAVFNGTDYTKVASTTATGNVTLAANNAFTGANTFYNSTGQTFGTATSTQDGIIVSGRAGGSASYRITLAPTTLASNTTLSLPNVTDTVATIGTAQTFTAAQTFRAANSVRAEAASTQDAMVLAGRAGGSTSYAVTLTPTTLTASRTVTFPDANINFTTGLGVAQGGTGQTSYTDGQLLIGNTTGNTLAKATLTAGSGITITNGAGSITIASASVGSTLYLYSNFGGF